MEGRCSSGAGSSDVSVATTVGEGAISSAGGVPQSPSPPSPPAADADAERDIVLKKLFVEIEAKRKEKKQKAEEGEEEKKGTEVKKIYGGTALGDEDLDERE